MARNSKPQRGDDDPGFEVVGDPGFEVVNPASAKPRPAAGTPAVPAKAVPAKPVNPPQTGRVVPAKVVPATSTAAKAPGPVVRKAAVIPATPPPAAAPKKPKVQVVDDDEDASSRNKSTTTVAVSDTPSEGTKKRLSAREKKRIRRELAAEQAEEWKKEKQEWTVPAILMGIGLVLMLGSAGYLASQSPNAAFAAVLVLGVSAAYIFVIIPIAVMLMMIVGKLFGIDYGSLKHVLRTLIAFLIFLVGTYFLTTAILNEYALLVTPTIAGIIGYVMFMKFFELDAEEARTSTFIINVITWLGNIPFYLMIGAFLLPGAERGAYDNEFDEDSEWIEDEDWDEDTPGLHEDVPVAPGMLPAGNDE